MISNVAGTRGGEREGCEEEGNQEMENRKTGISLKRLPAIPSTDCSFFLNVQTSEMRVTFSHKGLIYKLLFKWILAKIFKNV
jgi:hypothetical protein